ncbi:DEAD-box helicase Dbp80-like [Bacillus rossius redtenbacheri]|uniref:DEAD-box helicase Dbp80-like n=1 Tax=Bacillus rossius redtenbacheri TaxID=93214 RepID=UPI002FDEEA5B
MSANKVNWGLAAEEQEKSLLQQLASVELQPRDLPSPSRPRPATPPSREEEAQENGGGGDAGAKDDEEETCGPAEVSLLRKIVRKGLVESIHDIEVQRQNPSSPLYSIKSFDELHLKPELLKGVYNMGFNAPSKIQETAVPTLLADPPQNMIAQSQSGTGKTAAFVLAMLSRVDTSKPYPQALCLSPTYELAIQTGEVAAKMSQFCKDIKIRYAVRGEELARGSRIKEHIIIGTPGKVLDWGVKFKFFDLSKISVFVLDEADVMIATQGHQDQSFRIHKMLPRNCQMMFFSATYENDVMEFAEAIVSSPVIIRLKREEESLDNIKQFYVTCRSEEDKFRAISNIYSVITIGQAIIFCHTRKTAAWLSEKMSQEGHAVALLTGDLTVDQRIAVLDRFRDAKERVLITTNVLSRGIDVELVTMVVNYDLPMDLHHRADCETYLHRIGRTGRFGKSGLAINLIDGPQSMAQLRDIEKHFGKKIFELDAQDADEIGKLGRD